MPFQDFEMDKIERSITIIVHKRIDEIFKDKLNSEIRNAVKSEMEQLLLKMKDIIR